MGHLNVDLYANTQMQGGEFYFWPDEKSLPCIRVGLDGSWPDTISWLLHEALEFALCHRQLRFARTAKLNGDHADFLFVFDHCEYGNVCSMVGRFLVDALPAWTKAYREWKRKG